MFILLTTLLNCTLDIWVFKYHDTTNSNNYLCFSSCSLTLHLSCRILITNSFVTFLTLFY